MLYVKTCPKCGSEMTAEIDVEVEYVTNGDGEICYDGEGMKLETGRTRKVVVGRQCDYCSHYECGDPDNPDDVENPEGEPWNRVL